MLQYKVQSYESLQSQLATFFATPLGKSLLEVELNEIDDVLSTLFGYFIVKMGYPSGGECLRSSCVQNKIILAMSAEQQDDEAILQAMPSELPFAENSVDVMVLSHVLEFTQQPYQVLSECERVLVGDGHLVIIGFNPFSLWGLWRLLSGWRGVLGQAKMVRIMRLKHWLLVLGFEIFQVRNFYFRPPIQKICRPTITGSRRVKLPALGGVYCMVARKHDAPLIPTKLVWRQPKGVVSNAVSVK